MAEAESLETAAEHERILREIESTDTACIGPTLRYPPGTGATDGRVRAGRGPGSFGAVCLAGRPQGQRQPPVSGIPESDLHPGQGGSPQPGHGVPTRPPTPTAQLLRRPLLPSSRLGQPWFCLRGRPRAGRLERARQMVAFSRSSPWGHHPSSPTQTPSCPRHKSCSTDKTEIHSQSDDGKLHSCLHKITTTSQK